MRAIQFAATLFACAALSACSPKIMADNGTALTIAFDEGGIIELYEERVDAVIRQGKRVRLAGFCASACTMYLAANTCVTPNAIIGFHGSIPFTWMGETKAGEDAKMARYYTPELRDWFYANAAHIQVFTKNLSGQEMHDMFGYPLC